jgi:hypothetical protein
VPLRAALAAAVVVLAAAPGSAMADDTYVDQGDGADASNNCSSSAAPCKTITKGIAQAGSGDTVFVGGGETYTASFTLDGGKSLVQKDFSTTPSVDTSGATILDNSASSDADITITGNQSTVSGFTIRAGYNAIDVRGNTATISGNLIANSSASAIGVLLDNTSLGATVTDNEVTSSNPASNNFGIYVGTDATGFSTVTGNEVSGFWNGIIVLQGNADVRGNTISAPHDYPGGPSAGINVPGASRVTIENDTIDNALGTGASDGIQILSSRAVVSIDTTLISNASNSGITVRGPRSTITLSEDAITGVPGSGAGITMTDDGANSRGVSDVIATNITIEGKGPAVIDSQANLTLNSSLLDAGAIQASGSGAKCHISYSRGPSKHSGKKGCKDFQTKVNPKLKSDGYHLKSSSHMIDKGNPNDPPKRATDIDGDKRALDGDCRAHHGKKRRDIGADEFKCP